MKGNVFGFMALALFVAACTTFQPKISMADELDLAIREASDYLNKNVPSGSKLVILNIKSDYPPLSEYIIDVLTGNMVNDRIFTVVDRAHLALIQQEMDFQLSGEVSDESAQSIGQKLGAQTIVSGSIRPFGDLWRLTVRALGVESATVQGLFNRNIPNGTSMAALTSGGTAPAAASGAASGGGTPKARQAAAPAAPATVYKIGDIGPAGGIIFYDLGFYMDGWRYMEAAPQDFPTRVKWTSTGIGTFSTETGVGAGRQNSSYLVSFLNSNGETLRAAQVVNVPKYGGYEDWFLPSKDELSLMYENLKKQRIGSFSNNVYWSSSGGIRSGLDWNLVAWQMNFADGAQTRANGAADALVRAARRF
jgi:TolB-like protein